MTDAIFPLAFASDEMRLLTAIVLGFLFGFSLERAGFGNARKLAGQFYLHDMTVFKVMFTAILVAMVGLYSLAHLGWVDLSLLWINPTFMWAQVVGGFLLGVGFIMSGLCPGTSVVSAASGRWDGLATLGGIFVGTFLFVVLVDVFPAVESLYHSGSMGVSVLPELFGVPPLALALGVVVMALGGFVGAEKVESIFQRRYGMVELTPPSRPRLKFALAGALGVVAAAGLGVNVPAGGGEAPAMAGLDPLALAETLIRKEPGVMILDLREGEGMEGRIPGAYPAPDPETALQLLATAPRGTTVILYDDYGEVSRVPETWPSHLSYRSVDGGFLGWEFRVLTPAPPGKTLEDREWAARQNQISAFFSGAAVSTSLDAPPPPPMPAGGAAPKKKAGGC